MRSLKKHDSDLGIPCYVSGSCNNAALRHRCDATHSLPVGTEVVHLTRGQPLIVSPQWQIWWFLSWSTFTKDHTCRTSFSDRVNSVLRELSTAICTMGSVTHKGEFNKIMDIFHSTWKCFFRLTVIGEGELEHRRDKEGQGAFGMVDFSASLTKPACLRLVSDLI